MNSFYSVTRYLLHLLASIFVFIELIIKDVFYDLIVKIVLLDQGSMTLCNATDFIGFRYQ